MEMGGAATHADSMACDGLPGRDREINSEEEQ